MMATFEFYAYFNIHEMAALFDGVAAIAGSADYLDVFKLVAMLSFLVFIAGLAVGKGQEPFEFFRWLMIVVVVHSILLVPKANVVFIDRTGISPPMVRGNIPIGLAFFGSVTSHVGDTITRMFETVFALPDDLKFQRNGIMFGNTVLVDSLQTVPTTPSFRDDLVTFINSCTYYDIIAGRVSQDMIARTDDIWSLMSTTSNALTTRISTSPSGSKTCTAAYADLNTRWPNETTQTLRTRGRTLNPQSINNIVAGALLTSQIGSSYTQLTDIAKSATDMLRQNMTLNSVRDSQLVAAQKLDAASSAIVGAAQAQAEMGMVTNYLTMARVAERAAPGIRNVIELICYGVFPLVILLLIVAGEQAGKLFKTYVMSLIWVQLIPPLYAILNFVMTSASRYQLVGIAESASTTATVNLVNIGELVQKGLSESAIAGFLTLSLPIIAYALVKSGEVGVSSLYSTALAPARSATEGAANNIAAGNVNQGNVALDTTSANNVNSNHYDTAPSMASGFSRVSSAAGTAIFGGNGTFRFQGNQSTLGLSANFGQKIGNALNSQADQRREVASRESEVAAQLRSSALVERMGIVKTYADQHGIDNLDDASRSAKSSTAVARLQQISEQVNQRLGLSANSAVGQKIVGTVATGGKVSLETSINGGILGKLLPISARASVSGELSTSSAKIDEAEKRKSLEAAVSFAKEQVKNKNITSEEALSADFRSSEAYTWGQHNRSDSIRGHEATLQSSEQHTKNAETARSQAFSLSHQASVVQEQWVHSSMDYTGYLANRLHQDGKLDAFNMLYQTAPEKAASMAAGYLAETIFDVMPTPRNVSIVLPEVQAHSPEMAHKSLETEEHHAVKSANRTPASSNHYRSVVRANGYQEKPIVNTVREKVESAVDSNMDAIAKEQVSMEAAAKDARQKTSKELKRSAQVPGMNGPTETPRTGSVAEQQDKVHRDLFGTDKNKSKR